MSTLVIGLGQPLAGDDGVGLAVIDELERRAAPGMRLARASDASSLLELLPSRTPLVVVDAVLVSPDRVGEILVLEAEALARESHTAVSSHGVSVAEALELCRTLYGTVAPDFKLVAIGIRAPHRVGEVLSAPVERAVPKAARCIEGLVSQ